MLIDYGKKTCAHSQRKSDYNGGMEAEIMTQQTKFVAWLQTEMAKRKWSQKDLAEAMGLSAGAISRVMSGDRKPGEDFVKGAARALGYDVEFVLKQTGGWELNVPLSDEEQVILALFRSLNNEHKATAEQLLQALLLLEHGPGGSSDGLAESVN